MPVAAGAFPSGWLRGMSHAQGLLFPLAIGGAILVILFPLPPALMDVLLATNITLAVVILMATVSVQTPLELSVFPTLLLATTLWRLVLNVASTRLILTRAGSSGTAAAGQMIEHFGELVAGNRVLVGLVIFAIIVVIQFVVITRGATRISEVAARFVLDAMPGRQMAIDADLSAGLVDKPTARWQREELIRQADFFGAMDGAARFVWGDAIAGLVIMLVNILGGLYIGVAEEGMTVAQATAVFTRLTIGDGLATQIPAFILALSAGLLATRSSVPMHLGNQVLRQLATHPEALGIAGVFAALLAAGRFPRLPLLAIGVVCLGLAHVLGRRLREAARKDSAQPSGDAEPAARIEEFLHIDPMALEIGYGLLRLAERSRGGDLIERLQQLRQQTARDLGIILPKVRICDSLSIGPQDYVVKIRNQVVAQGTIPPDRWLALACTSSTAEPLGVPAAQACFGSGAWWIKPDLKAHAERQGYQVLHAAGAVMHHLQTVITEHAAELLSRDQVKRLIDRLKETSPALVEEVVPALLSTSQVHRVLQGLLREPRSIRDLETILETLGDQAVVTQDIGQLTARVRERLDGLGRLAELEGRGQRAESSRLEEEGGVCSFGYHPLGAGAVGSKVAA